MDLSIAIVNWNTRVMLAGCLASIAAHPPDVPYEVWVVDNASADGSAAMVRERFPEVRLIENAANVGFAAANNQAIRRSAGTYVLLLNPDTEVRPGALQGLVAFLEARPRAGAAGARLLNPDGSLQPSCHPMLTPGREFWRLMFLERIWPRATYAQHRWDAATPRRVEVIKGACLALRAEALEQVGLPDEGYFMYTEEVDLCHRLGQAGWGLWYDPESTVVHHGAQSTAQVHAEMYLQLYRSKMQFFRKYGGAGRVARYRRVLRAAYWPRAILATAAARFSPSLGERARIYRELLAELQAM